MACWRVTGRTSVQRGDLGDQRDDDQSRVWSARCSEFGRRRPPGSGMDQTGRSENSAIGAGHLLAHRRHLAAAVVLLHQELWSADDLGHVPRQSLGHRSTDHLVGNDNRAPRRAHRRHFRCGADRHRRRHRLAADGQDRTGRLDRVVGRRVVGRRGTRWRPQRDGQSGQRGTGRGDDLRAVGRAVVAERSSWPEGPFHRRTGRRVRRLPRGCGWCCGDRCPTSRCWVPTARRKASTT